MLRFDREVVLTVLVVEGALLAMAFGLKIDHDTLERELEVAREYEATQPGSIDYGILGETSRAAPVDSEYVNPLFDLAIERLVN